MSRSAIGVVARVAAVLGIVGATTLQTVTAHATDHVSFLSCTSPTPTPTSTAPTSPPDSSPSPTPTPDNCVPNSGTVLTDVRTMRFSASTDTFQTHIDEVQAFIDSHSNGVPSPDPSRIIVQCPTGDEDSTKPGCQMSNAAPKNGIYAVPWDTNDLTPYNGVYTFRVKVHFVGPTHDSTVTVPSNNQCSQGCNLVVDNPPEQPNPPHIVVTTSSSVTVAWDANPEPDVLSYTVYRAVTKDKNTVPTDAQFSVDFVAAKDATSVRETVQNSGAYWYRVQATRRSFSPAHRDTGISSTLSDRSGPGVVGTSPSASSKPGTKKTSPRVIALPPPASAVLTPPGLIPTVAAAPPPVPDAPYSAYLPYKSSGTSEDAGPPAPEAGGTGGVDPRGAVLPVAVGAFLVSSALALGRMPF